MHPRSRPRVGSSACLLGEAVRYDGGHKRDPVLIETLGRRVEWMPVCPEVEIGLGTVIPRMHTLNVYGMGARSWRDEVLLGIKRFSSSQGTVRGAALSPAGVC